MTACESFSEVLSSPERAPQIPSGDDLYGWLIGSWEMDVFIHDKEDRIYRSKGEVHFSWVLEGRAVQDIWINPQRTERGSASVLGHNMYGSTFRVYDPAIQAWRVTWFNPVNGARDELIGRRQGKDIVQEGQSSDGTPIRWSFREVTPNSFRWFGERLEPDGETWRLQAEFHASRRK
jgi:hypothetical protein